MENTLEIKKKLCGNCGEAGHLWRRCNEPTTSYGIIAFRRSKLDYPLPEEFKEELGNLWDDGDESSLRILMVQRKDTIGFVDFLRGRYSNDPDIQQRQIAIFLQEMTQTEREHLRDYTFDQLWDELWINHHSKSFIHEKNYAQNKFHRVNLQHLLDITESKWKYTEWNPAKGRRGKFETNIECAQREFREESGYSKKDYQLIETLNPIIENFVGTNGIKYRHVYYFAVVNSEVEIPKINYLNKNQAGEVRKVGWFSMNQAITLIRDYDIEKKKVIQRAFEIFIRIEDRLHLNRYLSAEGLELFSEYSSDSELEKAKDHNEDGALIQGKQQKRATM